MTRLFICLLMIDSAWVAFGLFRKRNMWKAICLYWVILTLKNAFDFFIS